MRSHILIGFLLSLVWRPISAQEVQFEHIEEGLSHSNVICMLQDQYGFMWLGTLRGLDRFNGKSFEHFPADLEDSTALTRNWITALLEDQDGYIWVGTYGGGVCRYDPLTETFHRYQHVQDQTNTISHPRVSCIYQTTNGEIWIGTVQGINLYQPHTDDFKRFDINSLDMQNASDVMVIFEDADAQIWYGTNNAGIFRLDQDQNRVEPQDINGVTGHSVRSVYQTKDRSVTWLGTNAHGLFRMTSGNDSKPLFESIFPEHLAAYTILSLLQDQNQDLWIGTENGGLYRLNPKGKLDKFTTDEANENSLNDNSVWSMCETQSGVLWFGTYNGGLNKFDQRRFKLKHLSKKRNTPNSLSNNAVNALAQADSNTYWIGTDGGGLNLYDAQKGTFKQINHIPSDPQSLSSDAILRLKVDSRNRLIICTWGGGISVMADASNFENKFQIIDPQANFFDIIEVPAENGFYAATWGNGLEKYDYDFNLVKAYRFRGGDAKDQISSGNIFSLLYDHLGRLWIGTIDGLNIKENKADGSEVFTHFMHDPQDKQSLPSNTILCLYQDQDRKIWIGTSEGLGYFDESLQKILPVNQKWSRRAINAIIQDETGEFWISAGKSLHRLSSKMELIQTLTQGDGVQKGNFKDKAVLLTQNGDLFFGGNDGFNILSKEDLVSNPVKPKVYFTDFKIFNQSVPIAGPGSTLTKSILLTESLTLDHTQEVFSISYIGISYTHPDQNTYAFKLEGLESEWNEVGSQQTASYSNLDAGTYTFMVKAANNDGLWSEPKSLKITVIPPWWKTSQAQAAFWIAIVGALVAIYLVRTSILKQQKRALESKVERRTKDLQSANENLKKQQEEILTKNEELIQQAEEIAIQRDQIQNQHQALEASYQDIYLIGQIGQEVTSSLSLEQLVETVHSNLSKIMAMDSFAIAIYREPSQRLEFWGIDIEHEGIQTGEDSIKNTSLLSVKCFQEQKPIFIENFQEQFSNQSAKGNLDRQSLIYAPLTVKEQRIGIITIQNIQAGSFKKRDYTLIQALANYVAIALDNAQAYSIIKESNTKITDSIRYAETIQQAILPSYTQLKSNFNHIFVLYRPKDIVSGDFYWHLEFKENGRTYQYLALADCTGHGVPGAFMSMIGSRILNEVVLEKGCRTPSEILDLLDISIRTALNQDTGNKDANKDGMDIGVIRLEYLDETRQNAEILYGGAKNTLWITENNSIKEIKGDRRHIGGITQKKKLAFTDHHILLNGAQTLYLSSDGIIDQNDPNRNKIGTSRLKEWILAAQGHSMEDQRRMIEASLDHYQQKARQRDDISLIGLKPV